MFVRKCINLNGMGNGVVESSREGLYGFKAVDWSNPVQSANFLGTYTYPKYCWIRLRHAGD